MTFGFGVEHQIDRRHAREPPKFGLNRLTIWLTADGLTHLPRAA
jgi:hypothetical protein